MVEHMVLMTIIGELVHADRIVKAIIGTGTANPVNSELGLRVLRGNYSASWGLPSEMLTDSFTRLPAGLSLDIAQQQLDTLFTKLKLQVAMSMALVPHSLSREALLATAQALIDDFDDLNARMDALNERLEKLRRFSAIGQLEDIAFDLGTLGGLEHFDVQLGTMGYEYELRMDLNYENIDAIVFKAGMLEGQQVYLFVTPRIKRKETDALLRSMYFEPIEILWELMDYPKATQAHIREALSEIHSALLQTAAETEAFKTTHQATLIGCMAQLSLENTYDSLRTLVTQNGHLFLFTAWVPLTAADSLEAALPKDLGPIYTLRHDPKAVKGATVPTKLKNNWLVRPFETLVTLYGTPNYHEIDPTGFVAIAYMLLFGAMFGDIGQGFVFWLVGRLLEVNRRYRSVGGVLCRIGLSSLFFGLIYDSFFGIEHLLSNGLVAIVGDRWLGHPIRDFFVSPIENTNLILLLSILLGLILLVASFIMSIINKLRQRDFTEGLFGRNGINGLVLFAALIGLGFIVYEGSPGWVFRLTMTVIVLSMLVLVLRVPLGNRLMHRLPLYRERTGEYLLESGFELFETLLSMLSNGVSFIRVGAFALNHAGLFIAFHTMAAMSSSHLGDIALFILGNVVVIALEGLIVFIQGLRLVYYELFSKYYAGDGLQFVGIGIGMRLDKQGK